MKKILHFSYCLTLLLLPFFVLQAQFVLEESTNGSTVVECEGTLEDNGEDGNNPGDYGLNQDLSFTVCIPDAIEICIFTVEFWTEEDHDSLNVYTGPNTSGQLLLTLNGETGANICLPGAAAGGNECFTFFFHSDQAVTRPGFIMGWDAIIEQPPPIPPFGLDGISCFDETIVINLPAPILCEYVDASSFTLSGPSAPGVATAIPLDCVDGLTTNIQIQLDGAISASGNYNLLFQYVYVDICGDPHNFSAPASFSINDCPLEASLPPYFYNCGNCAFLEPDVTGGDGNYSYEWNPPLEGGSITLPSGAACPPVSGEYVVTVTDGLGQTDTATTFIEVCPLEVSLPDAEFCEGECIDITAVIIGGYPDFSFEWAASNPSSVSNTFFDAATNTICAVNETNVTVTVTDNTGNTASATASMTVCPFDASVDAPTEFCGTPQSISVNAVGGSGEYAYTWSPALPEGDDVSNGTVDIIMPTVYTVTVTDVQSGETIILDDIFIDVCTLSVGIAGPDTLCNDTAPIEAIVNGLSGNYTYLWNPALPEGADIASGTADVTEPTTYTLTVTDLVTGEVQVATWFVAICPLQVIVVAPTYLCDTISEANSCISVFANVEGGDENYTYNWLPPFDTLPNSPGPFSLCLLDTTMLIGLEVIDGNGISDTDFDVLSNCPLYVYTDGDNQVCDDNGYCANVEVLAFGGDFDYTYAWQPPYDYLSGPGPHSICTTESITVGVQVTSGTTTIIESHDINVCPYNINIEANDSLCAGQQSEIELNINGGLSPFSLSWDVNGMGNTLGLNDVMPYDPPSSIIAPDVTIPTTDVIVATVTDGNGTERRDTIWMTYFPSPILPDTIAFLCEDASNFDLTPTIGSWSGNGVSGNSFNPSNAGPGVHELYYEEVGCENTTQIVVYPTPQLQGDLSACENGEAFMLEIPSVAGIWSNANGLITFDGLFTPSLAGNHIVTYTTDNGCTNSLEISIADITLDASADVACGSTVDLTVSPSNGWWTSSDGLNETDNEFYPWDAGEGIHTLTYNLAGSCSDSLQIEVVSVETVGIIQICPSAVATIELPNDGLPEGGLWQEQSLPTGLINAATGLYNPNVQGGNDYTETLEYVFDDCSDELTIEVVSTTVSTNSLSMCWNEGSINLMPYGSPAGGSWSGDGVLIDTDGNASFIPPTEPFITTDYVVSYSLNDCTQNISITVFPVNAGQDIVKCSSDAQFVIPDTSPAIPLGGLWEGTGIVPGTASIGIFDPLIADIGANEIVYTSPDGCTDTLIVFVNNAAEVSINSFGTNLCYADIDYPLEATPVGGIFTSNNGGISGNDVDGYTFNPVDAGPGSTLITYTFDNGCSNIGFYAINVGDSLAVQTYTDTLICLGATTPISAFASGGWNTLYDYTWNNGLGNGQLHPVSPNNSTQYTVTVSDGCSEPAIGTVNVEVVDSINVNYNTNGAVCYGEQGYIDLIIPPDANYSVDWEHTSQDVTYIEGEADTYYATITDNNTGCNTALTIDMPRYPLIYANFETNENRAGCLSTLGLYFTDFSEGGQVGSWDFGDGTSQDYLFGEIVYHEYNEPGDYTVSLFIENEGNCESIYTNTICIELTNDMIVPNAFSPNGDGVNDYFKATGVGVATYELNIYNRWGEKIFNSTDIGDAWDGIYNDKPAQTGVYVYELYFSINREPEKLNYWKGNVTLVR